MYDYISGDIAELNPAYAVLDNQGIGYMINISLTTSRSSPCTCRDRSM